MARRRKKRGNTGRILGLLLLACAAAGAGVWALWRISRGAREAPAFHFPTAAARPKEKQQGGEIEPQERARLDAILRGTPTARIGDPARRR